MRKFDYCKLAERSWPSDILNFVAKIHECKGGGRTYMSGKSPWSWSGWWRSSGSRAPKRRTISKFTGAEVIANCPIIGRSSALAALKRLAEEGWIVRKGAGRNTWYVKADSMTG